MSMLVEYYPKAVQVTIVDATVYAIGFVCYEESRDGYAVPWFEYSEAERVLKAICAIAGSEYDDPRFDADSNAFCARNTRFNTDTMWNACKVEVDGMRRDVYGIGNELLPWVLV